MLSPKLRVELAKQGRTPDGLNVTTHEQFKAIAPKLFQNGRLDEVNVVARFRWAFHGGPDGVWPGLDPDTETTRYIVANPKDATKYTVTPWHYPVSVEVPAPTLHPGGKYEGTFPPDAFEDTEDGDHQTVSEVSTPEGLEQSLAGPESPKPVPAATRKNFPLRSLSKYPTPTRAEVIAKVRRFARRRPPRPRLHRSVVNFQACLSGMPPKHLHGTFKEFHEYMQEPVSSAMADEYSGDRPAIFEERVNSEEFEANWQALTGIKYGYIEDLVD
ncbi:hypothetical protein EJ06DRAFT_553568 [Trichodelitschia bisporula]|uniref:Uncharacterized protein n=1 Tax=Trichodelitschia bisporula TaxID=703511 RepID=A0A6G1I9M0_9PEZI|nr:hypothetical protein EJ06DRAFT_553568 [Trichodelitschia bisporula]